jgi:YVTN family beta-propeller protein
MRKLRLFFLTLSLLGYSCKKSIRDEINYNAAYVINGGDHSISVIDLISNEVTHTFTLKGLEFPHHIYLSPDKSRLAISAPGIDLSEGHQHAGHTGKIKARIVTLSALDLHELECEKNKSASHNLIFSPDGNEAWCAFMDSPGKIQIYNAKKLKKNTSVDVGNAPLEVSFSADGTTAFVCNSASGTVTAIDVSAKTIRATITVGSTPVGAWPGSNNKMYVDNEESRTISVINVNTLSVEETISLNFAPAMVAYNSTTNELYVSDPTGGVIHYYTFSGVWTESGTFATGAGAHAIAISNDGSKAYITNQTANTVSVVDLSTKVKILDINVGKKPNGIVLRYL